MQILSKTVEKIKGIADADSVCMECQVKPAEIFQVNGEYLPGMLARHNAYQSLAPTKSRETYSPARSFVY